MIVDILDKPVDDQFEVFDKLCEAGHVRVCTKAEKEHLPGMIDKVLIKRMIKYANKETHKDGVIRIFPGYHVTISESTPDGLITKIKVRRRRWFEWI